MHSIVLFLAAGCIASTVAIYIEHGHCGGSKINQLLAEPCEKEVCEVPRGGFLNLTADFVAETDAEKIKMTVSGLIEGKSLIFPGLSRDGCKGTNIQCPVKKGDAILWKISLPIKSFFPQLNNVGAKVLLETSSEILSCFTGQVSIV